MGAKGLLAVCTRVAKIAFHLDTHEVARVRAIIGGGEDLIKNSSQARARARTRVHGGRNRPEGQEGIGEKGLRRQSRARRGGGSERAEGRKGIDVLLRARGISSNPLG